jgi:guanylate kinase
MLKNSTPIIISAPSGAGKSTIIKQLIREYEKLEFSISSTTRPLRGKEIDGKDYYFIDKDSFSQKIVNEDFIEWALVHGNYYGTEKKEIDRIWAQGKIPIFDIDVQGAETLREKLPDALFIFIIPPSLEELYRRLKDRKTDSDDTIRLRINNARTEMKKYQIFDYIVVNDTLDEAVNDIKAVLKADTCKTIRLENYMELLLEENNDNTP